MTVDYTAADLVDKIRTKFSDRRGYALIEEVRNGTGFAGNRSIDAIAVQTWPSRGITADGFEVKVSRSDWLRELANPAKADAIANYLDRFWIVAPSDVVNVDELPDRWGLLVPRGGGLGVEKPAPKRDPVPLDRIFVAAIARRCVEQLTESARIEAARKAGYDEGVKVGRGRGENDRDLLKCEIEQWEKVAAEFEEASGVKITKWSNGYRIGRAVRTVLSQNVGPQLRRSKETLERLVAELDSAIEEIEEGESE